MRPARPKSGITLLQLLVVLLVLSVLGSLIVTMVVPARRRRVEVQAEVALKELVSTQGVWRGTDSDRNGAQDYWTKDVAGFYCVMDSANRPLHYIAPELAAADAAPAIQYPGLPVYDPITGYRLGAMITDENGAPYVDPSRGPVFASPVSGMRGTNCCKYAFYAHLDRSWGRAGAQFIVNEDGVVYRADTTGPAPVTTWPAACDWQAGTLLSPPWIPVD